MSLRTTLLSCTLYTLSSLVPSARGHAETPPAVYKWQDAQGRTHYSDHGADHSTTLAIRPNPTFFRVDTIYDGDTLRLQDGRKIRLLGINTPEVASRHRLGEPGGEEAKQWLNQQLRGRAVRLEFDSEKQDKYQRWLAHVFDDYGRHLNVELVRRGLAFVSIYPPNLRYSDTLLRAEREAERQSVGIWRLPFYAPKRASEYDGTAGWQRLRGVVMEIKQGRKYLYLRIAPHVSARIENGTLVSFSDWRPVIGQRLEVRGWPYRGKQGFVVPIRHPSALRTW